LGKSPKHVKFS